MVLVGYMVRKTLTRRLLWGTILADFVTSNQAHVCVSTTARQAHELGYEVVIAEDGVGDRDLPGKPGAEVTKVIDCLFIDYA